MYKFLQDITSHTLPVSAIPSTLDVGLTRNPTAIRKNIPDWHFLVRVLLAIFTIVASLMVTLVNLVGNFTPTHAAGLMIMSVCADASFLIILTQTSENDMARGDNRLFVDPRYMRAYRPTVPARRKGEHTGTSPAVDS